MENPVYIIEADNPDGTYSRVAQAGIWKEAEHELRKASLREGTNPFAKPRRLSVWHVDSATCLATWEPA